MKQHVLAFSLTTSAAGVTLGQVPATPEQAFTISGAGNFQVPWPLKLFAGYAGGIGLLDARFNTGSLRARGFPHIWPQSGGQAAGNPFPYLDSREYPIQLAKEEDLRVDISTTAAINTFTALAWVTPDPINYNTPPIDLRALQFTATCTVVANAWSAPATVILQDVLEGGVYDIYGMAIAFPGPVVGRLILQGEFFRPGCLSQATLLGQATSPFWGGTGKWASFNTYSPPQIEVIGTTAGAQTVTGYLLCTKSMQATVTTVPGAPGTMGY